MKNPRIPSSRFITEHYFPSAPVTSRSNPGAAKSKTADAAPKAAATASKNKATWRRAAGSNDARKIPKRRARPFDRLIALGPAGRSVSESLNQYVKEGGVAKRYDLLCCVRQFRKFCWFRRALEVFRWMEERRIPMSATDNAIRLDIVSNAQGLSAAQSYFDGLPFLGKNQLTYGSLLHSYCHHKLADGALAVFEKMEGLNMVNYMAYDSLMSLYLRLDQPEKVRPLVDKMKKRNIPLSHVTYKHWMKSCACLNDITGVEMVLRELQEDDQRKWHWTIYGDLASIYVKAGYFQKAEKALINIYDMMPRDRGAHHLEIFLYAEMGNLDAVWRAWNRLKRRFEKTNSSFLIMINALVKLEDVEGLKRCFGEWKSSCSYYKLKIVNAVIKAYLHWGMLEDAQREFHDAIEKSPRPLILARKLFMRHFLQKGEIGSAMEFLDGAFAAVDAWQPKPYLVEEFFKCLEEKADVEGAEGLCTRLKKVGCLDSGAYQGLIRVYLGAGRVEPEMRQRVEEDGIEIDSELENSLRLVTP